MKVVQISCQRKRRWLTQKVESRYLLLSLVSHKPNLNITRNAFGVREGNTEESFDEDNAKADEAEHAAVEAQKTAAEAKGKA
jgi:hypothetical protein